MASYRFDEAPRSICLLGTARSTRVAFGLPVLENNAAGG